MGCGLVILRGHPALSRRTQNPFNGNWLDGFRDFARNDKEAFRTLLLNTSIVLPSFR